MNSSENILARFFGVAVRGQTYLNLLYLFLSFPLGLFYFIFLVIGLSLGFSLLIVWAGLLILPVVFAGWWAFAAFERQLAIWLLREDIPPMASQQPAAPGLWAQIVAYLSNPVTWKALLYLFAKFPLGLLSFIAAITALSVSAAFLVAPLLIPFFPLQVWLVDDRVWRVDTLGEALVAFVIGLFLSLVSLHILNGLAWLSGHFARLMLGNFQKTGAAPAPTAGPLPAREVADLPADPISSESSLEVPGKQPEQTAATEAEAVQGIA
jgi:hypothetical protein